MLGISTENGSPTRRCSRALGSSRITSARSCGAPDSGRKRPSNRVSTRSAACARFGPHVSPRRARVRSCCHFGHAPGPGARVCDGDPQHLFRVIDLAERKQLNPSDTSTRTKRSCSSQVLTIGRRHGLGRRKAASGNGTDTAICCQSSACAQVKKATPRRRSGSSSSSVCATGTAEPEALRDSGHKTVGKKLDTADFVNHLSVEPRQLRPRLPSLWRRRPQSAAAVLQPAYTVAIGSRDSARPKRKGSVTPLGTDPLRPAHCWRG
jgi:hypothetical protein